MEEAILATLEGLAEAVENKEEPIVFQQEERDTLMILGSDFCTRGGGEGNGGGGGRYEPTH